MRQTLNFIGKTCPIPVIETKKALNGLMPEDVLEVLVDNSVAVQNLSKLATQMKLTIESEKKEENLYQVILTVKDAVQINETTGRGSYSSEAGIGPTVVALSSDKMGEGDEKLGHILMKGFIYALTELEELPEIVLMYNNGVKLAVEGSESLADLKLLEAQGVEILSCGTCLNHYQLTEKLGTGSITNMYTIVEKLSKARKVIKP
ncbi:MAG: selenium metabolism protein YedF [Herbinix sp.]|jgi:selenium metabolism protein YedF|nr:selenium metabolism protein YedF [Herbinix sp.]